MFMWAILPDFVIAHLLRFSRGRYKEVCNGVGSFESRIYYIVRFITPIYINIGNSYYRTSFLSCFVDLKCNVMSTFLAVL